MAEFWDRARKTLSEASDATGRWYDQSVKPNLKKLGDALPFGKQDPRAQELGVLGRFSEKKIDQQEAAVNIGERSERMSRQFSEGIMRGQKGVLTDILTNNKGKAQIAFGTTGLYGISSIVAGVTDIIQGSKKRAVSGHEGLERRDPSEVAHGVTRTIAGSVITAASAAGMVVASKGKGLPK